jgi:hypothetical protein
MCATSSLLGQIHHYRYAFDQPAVHPGGLNSILQPHDVDAQRRRGEAAVRCAIAFRVLLSQTMHHSHTSPTDQITILQLLSVHRSC